MKNPFSKIKSNNVVNKTFSYSKGKVGLNFTLRTDIKSDLKDFLALLVEAQKEVELELK
jgi:small-conductance mechanosensitive channel